MQSWGMCYAGGAMRQGHGRFVLSVQASLFNMLSSYKYSSLQSPREIDSMNMCNGSQKVTTSKSVHPPYFVTLLDGSALMAASLATAVFQARHL